MKSKVWLKFLIETLDCSDCVKTICHESLQFQKSACVFCFRCHLKFPHKKAGLFKISSCINSTSIRLFWSQNTIAVNFQLLTIYFNCLACYVNLSAFLLWWSFGSGCVILNPHRISVCSWFSKISPISMIADKELKGRICSSRQCWDLFKCIGRYN